MGLGDAWTWAEPKRSRRRRALGDLDGFGLSLSPGCCETWERVFAADVSLQSYVGSVQSGRAKEPEPVESQHPSNIDQRRSLLFGHGK